MCVTDTTRMRRPQPVTLSPQMVASAQQVAGSLEALQSVLINSVACQIAQPPVTADAFCVPTAATPAEEKARPKRRRRQQKPGKTAKMNDRHFVVHNYHDHLNDPDEVEVEEFGPRRRGGVSVSFPIKLHSVLDQVEADGLTHVVSWQPHGRCFVVHKPKEFVETILPDYFRQTKLTSFQRQLNLYGFFRLTRGPDAGGYYHELFLRGKPYLCKRMVRIKVKGTGFKAASSPEQEPDFYTMPPVVVTPNSTSDEETSSVSSAHEGSGNVTPYSEPATEFQMPQSQVPSWIEALQAISSLPLSPRPERLAVNTQLCNALLNPAQEFFSQLSNAPPCLAAEAPAAMPARPSNVTVDESGYLVEELVDELFLQQDEEDGGADEILDFVQTWCPSTGVQNHNQCLDVDSMDDDAYGMLLERLIS